ncbi:MAG: D-Ala-D-Ala carboxypeptidase family metallohydrolase [Caulobacterales bacterium]
MRRAGPAVAMNAERVHIVAANALNLRAGPRTIEPVLAVLARGQPVARLDETDFFGWWWVFADLREGGLFTGYVFAEHLRPAIATLAPPPAPEPSEPGASAPVPEGPEAPTDQAPTDPAPTEPPAPVDEPETPQEDPPRGGVVDREKTPRHEEVEVPQPHAPGRAPHGTAVNAISLEDYFGPHLATSGAELTDAHKSNARELVTRVNALLKLMEADGVTLDRIGEPTGINSGWRPIAHNAKVPGAAPGSHHIRAAAIDLSDTSEAIDGWCLRNLHHLERLGLWLEAPQATRRWCHLQIVPPRSGRRVFIP